jgi:hypothetical protein
MLKPVRVWWHASQPPQKSLGQLDIGVEGDRMICIDATKTAIVIVDMQK